MAGHLGILARSDFVAENIHILQALNSVCPEEGILLESTLVLDDHTGDSQALQLSHGEGKDLLGTPGVPVVEYGFVRHLEHIIHNVEALGRRHRLYVRLAFDRAGGQGGGPKAIESDLSTISRSTRCIHNKGREAAVDLDHANDALLLHHRSQHRQPCSSCGHRSNCTDLDQAAARWELPWPSQTGRDRTASARQHRHRKTPTSRQAGT
mmetsp:Transcript_119552/g.283906  ORF Transcript_119552/g.283906 Transcript_119552/m.283906 type:complete len:209 (+) Transcript_119552:566-1192(+)